ncbi:hypothetical protein EIP91_005163 [Steccherinum ochraceum]|uniref:F-box domain-containing protein n=1 Tax=Steccherinum ochraceum TaxID=92696 RepID=A0A4R0RA77_9APHY|nr:hypothetical protein EIP91_005163 [Steccherinum ochraceum]
MATSMANSIYPSPSHKVFQIPEIVELILSFLDRRENTNTARVCRRWSDIALTLLWRDVPDVFPLFSILSPLDTSGRRGSTGFEYVFTRNLGASDWERFSRYARRVRILAHNEDSVKFVSSLAFDEIARTRATLQILPNLGSLTWLTHTSQRMRFSLMFMHERVNEFIASLHLHDDYPIATFFNEVVLRMPHLTALDLRFDFGVSEIEAAIVELLGGLPKLKSVIFPLYTLTSRIVQQLSKLPHLGTIQFEFKEDQGQGQVEDIMNFVPHLEEGAFPTLFDLSLSARLSDITAFLGHMHGPTHLTHLYAHVITSAHPDEVMHFLTTISENCQQLTHLYIDYMASPGGVIPAPQPRLTWNALRPVLTLPNLIVFEMRWDLPIVLSQANVTEIASKWPSLEVLLLNCEPLDPSEDGTLTLDALLPFARHCPNLRELGLYLDATRISEDEVALQASAVKPFKNLKRLCMGLSTITEPGPVALFLSRLCPLGCEVASGVTWPEGFGMAETATNREVLDRLQAAAGAWWEKWAEVARTLPLLTKLRIQEREARVALEREVDDLRTRCRLLSERAALMPTSFDRCDDAVILIPELLTLILSYLDDRSVAKSATVCLRWADIALDVVWRDVHDIRRLLSLLAPLTTERQTGVLVSPGFNHRFKRNSSLDWNKFDRYARRVRHLYHDESKRRYFDDNVWNEILRGSPRDFLLPNLQSLEWLAICPERQRWSILFIHEKVRRLSLQIHLSSSCSAYIGMVLAKAVNLEELEIRSEEAARDIEPIVMPLLGCQTLQHFTVPLYFLTSSIFGRLALCSNLRTISLSKQASRTRRSAHVLHVHAAHFLQSAFSPKNIAFLHVNVIAVDGPLVVRNFFSTVANSCKLLKELHLDFVISPDAPIIYPPPPLADRPTIDTFRPLYSCHRLTRFEFRWDYQMNLTQPDIEEFASSLPSLEALLLNCQPIPEHTAPTLTLEALVPFARHCPRLTELGLYLDARETPSPLDPRPIPSFRHLRKLSVGASCITDVEPVALFLSQLCPLGCELISGVRWPDAYGIALDHLGILDNRRLQMTEWWVRWTDVAKVLPLATKARLEEKGRFVAVKQMMDKMLAVAAASTSGTNARVGGEAALSVELSTSGSLSQFQAHLDDLKAMLVV